MRVLSLTWSGTGSRKRIYLAYESCFAPTPRWQRVAVRRRERLRGFKAVGIVCTSVSDETCLRGSKI